MAKIKKTKLSLKEAEAYAKMSGFPNTGNVEVHTWDKETQEFIDTIMEDLYSPYPKNTNKST